MDIAANIIIFIICFVIVGIPTFILFIEAFKGNYKGPNGKRKGRGKRNRRRDNRNSFFDNGNRSKQIQSEKYTPFGNHWESSFDWKDEDNDGYDDRDDGFWNEREF